MGGNSGRGGDSIVRSSRPKSGVEGMVQSSGVAGGWISEDHSKEGKLFRGQQAVAYVDREVDQPGMAWRGMAVKGWIDVLST